jgi:SH3 domain-containing YSC84-like protein 1
MRFGIQGNSTNKQKGKGVAQAMRKVFIALSMVLLLTLSVGASPALDKKDTKTLQEAVPVLNALANAPDKGIPQELLAKAECILIFPSVAKGAFIVGGKAGKGVASCRMPNGTMSAPAFYEIGGASIGFQIGGQTADVVLLIMNEGGVSRLLSDKFTIGGEATATAGPVGRTAQAATDAQMHAQILSWSRSQGLFLGAALDGSVIKPDKEANEALYGMPISGKDILVDAKVTTPSQAKPLMQSIIRHMDAAAAKEQAEKVKS